MYLQGKKESLVDYVPGGEKKKMENLDNLMPLNELWSPYIYLCFGLTSLYLSLYICILYNCFQIPPVFFKDLNYN